MFNPEITSQRWIKNFEKIDEPSTKRICDVGKDEKISIGDIDGLAPPILLANWITVLS